MIVVTIFKIPNWGTDKVNIDYNVFLIKVKDNEIAKVRIGNEKIIYGKYKSSDEKNNRYKPEYDFVTHIPYNDPELVKILINNNVSVEGFDEDDNILLKGFISFLPFLILFGFIWFLMFRQIQGAGNKALAFGKSKAKLNPDSKNKVTFKDVAGADEAKAGKVKAGDVKSKADSKTDSKAENKADEKADSKVEKSAEVVEDE